MSTFKPMKSSDAKQQLKSALLAGKIIRYDGFHTSVEVIPREWLSSISSSDNLFQQTGSLYSYYHSPNYQTETISISCEARVDVQKELQKEYILNTVRCSGSGCCQYSTFAVYLEEE